MKINWRNLTVKGLQYLPVLLFLVIFLLFGSLSERFLQFATLVNIVKQASYIGIVAVGMTLVLLTAGIDLSVGSNMYLSAAVAGLLIQNYGLPVWLALLVCLTVGFLFGLVNAVGVTQFRVLPFVVTLSTMVAGRGLGLLVTKSRAVMFPDNVIRVGSVQILGAVPLPIFIFALVVVFVYVFLNQTPAGRQLYAIGNDFEAAEKTGIRVRQVQAAAYILCGVLAALGGFISVAQLGNVNSGFGEGIEFQAIAAAVLGGTSLFGGVGSVFPGTVLGALLIQMISTGLVFLQVDLYLQPLVSAAIIFLAVFLDSLRNKQLVKMAKRLIRTEK